MSDRDRMQGAREWHSSRDSERRREDEDRHRRERERERGDEWRRDNPERYRDWREREDSLGNGQRGSYGDHNSERSYGDDGWRGGGYGSSSDNPRREYPGAPRHVKQDARLSEQQRAEEERRAQVARELQQIQEREEGRYERGRYGSSGGEYGKYGSSERSHGDERSEWRDGGEYGYGRRGSSRDNHVVRGSGLGGSEWRGPWHGHRGNGGGGVYNFTVETQGTARIGFSVSNSGTEQPGAERERGRYNEHRDWVEPSSVGATGCRDDADALQNVFRHNHLVSMPGAGGVRAGTLAAHAMTVMVESRVGLRGEGEAHVELPVGAAGALRAATAADVAEGRRADAPRTTTAMDVAESSASANRTHGQKRDLAEGKKEMAVLIASMKKHGGRAREVASIEVLLEAIFGHVKASCLATSVQGLFKELECLLLPNPTLLGQVISSDVREVRRMLAKKVGAGLGAKLLEPNDEVARAIRLVQTAQCRGWCKALAALLAKMAKKVELVDKAADESSTFEDVCVAFDRSTEKANGQPLWSLSKKTKANLTAFRNVMTPAMKLKFPESRDATRVLEVANKRGWLERLARYAADKVADDAGDEDDDMPNMSRR